MRKSLAIVGTQTLTIKPPNFQVAVFTVTGTAPLVIHAFSAKARTQIIEKQKEGSQADKGRKRQPKDFDAAFNEARHLSTEGWDGIPAAAFRCAMIDACRTAGFKMTLAKQAIHIIADGKDKADGTPLVRIIGDKPRCDMRPARNDNGKVDIRTRPWWDEWGVKVRVRFDGDMFTVVDIANLLMRAGMQVGVCEGRPFSKNSAGMGWGTFTVEEPKK